MQVLWWCVIPIALYKFSLVPNLLPKSRVKYSREIKKGAILCRSVFALHIEFYSATSSFENLTTST